MLCAVVAFSLAAASQGVQELVDIALLEIFETFVLFLGVELIILAFYLIFTALHTFVVLLGVIFILPTNFAFLFFEIVDLSIIEACLYTLMFDLIIFLLL